MDILTHTCSGFAVATVVISNFKMPFKNKLCVLLLGAFAGALPDFDAISLWSKFDVTLGRFLHLTHSGHQIYFSKFWYSHHGFLHSLFASILFPIIYLSIIYIKNRGNFNVKLFNNKLHYILTFVFGFNMHLIEDLPTPYCVWGGVNYFWPSSKYIGGTGDIWWWNNYDIFLIVISVIVINLLISILSFLLKKNLGKYSITVFVFGLILGFYQIKTRNFDFNYKQHNVDFQFYELKSKLIQKEILGQKLYNFMVKFDNKVKVNF